MFIYEITNGLDTFQIQREELDGIYYMKLMDLFNIAKDTNKSALVTGYYYQGDEKVSDSQEISLADMQALPQDYLKPFIEKLQTLLK
ncbi:hypothetical protein MKX47_14750 [Solibacillus sp. FSL R7-0668]|uniref:hypothetical protein n=1 Tax=Solibacillus sp. FSL R7-0668 TaxID=2921688 RepID=UPI0030FB1AF4